MPFMTGTPYISCSEAGAAAKKYEKMIENLGLQENYKASLTETAVNLTNLSSETITPKTAEKLINKIMASDYRVNAQMRLTSSANTLRKHHKKESFSSDKEALQDAMLFMHSRSSVLPVTFKQGFENMFLATGISGDKQITEMARDNIGGMFSIIKSISEYSKKDKALKA